MSGAQYRMERIERLLKELEYEVTRGMMEREIDEEIGFRFLVPSSQKIPGGIVACEFRTRPTTSYDAAFFQARPTLRLVESKTDQPPQIDAART